MSNNPPEISNPVSESDLEKKIENLSLKDSSDPKDEKQKNTASETGPNAVTSNKIDEGDLENFAERLGLNKFTKDKDEWKKFYVFARPNFIWPSTMNVYERREVFDYIIYPDWGPIREELAINTIGYRRLLESGTLDESRGTHILIVHGELVDYGYDISPVKEKELEEKYPGYFYVPVVERFVEIRKFSANDDDRMKEWQTHICIRNVLNAKDEVKMANKERNFRMVIDTGATMTIIPYFMRENLYDPQDGWKRTSTRAHDTVME